MGVVSAVDSDNVSIKEDSNLDDSAIALSQDKLEISNEVSISETNLVNSQCDNLGDSSNDVLSSNKDENSQVSSLESKNNASNNGNDIISSENDVLSAKNSKVPVNMKVTSAISDSSSTIFKVSVSDSETGNSLVNSKVLLILNGVKYLGITGANGVADISTGALAKGTYEVTLRHAGTISRYATTEVTEKVNVFRKIPVNMKVTSAVSNSATTLFKVSVSDSENGNALVNSKVLLILNGVKYLGITDNKGVAEISTGALAKGTYQVTLRHAGTLSRYATTEVTEKVNVFRKIPVNMKVTSAVSNSTATLFKVSVSDSENGNALVNSKVLLILNGVRYLGITDNKGVAEISTGALAQDIYDVGLKHAGTISRYEPTLINQKVAVTTHIPGKVPVNMKVTSAVSDSTATIFKVSVSDGETGKALVNSKVLLILNGAKYLGITDGKGIAEISTGALAKGSYDIVLKHAGTISRYEPTLINQKVDVFRKILVNMKVTSAVSNSTATLFKVSVSDSENGNVLVNSKVLLILNGVKYLGITDNKGVAEIVTGPLAKGTYQVTLKHAGTISRYDLTLINQKVDVFRKILVKLTVKDITQSKSKTVFKVSALDSENGKALTNSKVLLILNGVRYLGITDNNGVAEISTGALADGVYDVTLRHAGTISRYDLTEVTQRVVVGVDKISLSNLISASKNVKNYIESNGALPSTVKINGITYTTAQYLYLASQAIYHLKSGDKSAVIAKTVNNPKSPATAGYLGNLKDYYSVAKRVIDYESSSKSMPGSVSSDVGNIGYDGLVYAFARVLAFYGDQSIMPNYVTIRSVSNSVSPNAVNTKNTITDLSPYLKATKNCQVDNAQIKALAAKLTNGLSSASAKATALYNYVRDSVSYSFYYDTKYGAAGTLNSKKGNCVDQAHLLVALYRASNLPARYVHGTCAFSDGTYGHVWTQVLIGNVWTVGDPTSTRNSLGSVANWNTNSYSLKGYYAGISF